MQKKKFISLNFIIHLVVAAQLFAVDNFNVAHVVGLGVVLLLVERRAADGGWTDGLISVMRIRLTALAGRPIVMIAVLRRCRAVHVRIILMVRDEVIREVMVLIVVAGVARRWRRHVVDALVKVRLVQLQECRRRDGHAATVRRL